MALRSKKSDSGTVDPGVGLMAVDGSGNTAFRTNSAARLISYPAQALPGLAAATLGLPGAMTSNCNGRACATGLRALAIHQERAREQERVRVARDLHDELGGLLSGLRARLSMAQSGYPFDAAAACQLADDAIASLRRVVNDLRPGVLDQLGLWDALAWYAQQWAGRQAMPVLVSILVDPSCLATGLDEARSTAAFRIVQEALTNVSRHAQAASVLISATCSGGTLVLAVADDGRGLPRTSPEAGSCWGIAGMRERAQALGGELTVNNGEQRGAVLELRLPTLDHANG